MDSLNNIPNVGNWGDAASKLNDNFNKIKQSLTTVENTSKNNKGYFTSLSALNTAFPSPKAGQTAYVYDEASSTKYYIYNAVNGGWVTASVEAPSIGVDISEYTKTGGSTKTTKQIEDDLVQLAGEKANVNAAEIILFGHPYTLNFDLVNNKIITSKTLVASVGNKRFVIPAQEVDFLNTGTPTAVCLKEDNSIECIELQSIAALGKNDFVLGVYQKTPENTKTITTSDFENYFVNGVDHLLVNHSRSAILSAQSTAININTSDKTLKIQGSAVVTDGSRRVTLTSAQTLELLDKQFAVIYARIDGTLGTALTSTVLPNDAFVFAGYYLNSGSRAINLEGIDNCLVDGVRKVDIPLKYVGNIGTCTAKKGAVNVSARINNTSNSPLPVFQLEIKGQFIVFYKNQRYTLTNQSVELSSYPSILYFRPSTGLIYNVNTSAMSSIPGESIIIASYNGVQSENFFELSGIDNYTVNELSQKNHDFRVKQRIVISNDLTDFYKNESDLSMSEESEMPLINTDPNDIYDMWDTLKASNPDYITKESIATVATTAGDRNINMYRFKPLDLTTVSNSDGQAIYRKNKLFFTCSLHGSEKTASIAIYMLMKDVCEKWQTNSFLTVLRNEIEIIIIPVSNPHGWISGSRKNGNGVDLNRNFPRDWNTGNNQGDPTSETYAGTAPLSEVESKSIMELFEKENEKGEIVFALDVHNFFDNEPRPAMTWFEGASYAMNDIARAAILELTRSVIPDLGVSNQMLGWVSEDIKGRGKAFAAYADTMMYSGAIECIDRLSIVKGATANGATTLRFATTAFGNYIRHFLREVIKDRNIRSLI